MVLFVTLGSTATKENVSRGEEFFMLSVGDRRIFAGFLCQVEECLTGKFRDAGIGMPEQGNEHSKPIEFMCFDANDRDGLRHKDLELLIGREAGNLRRVENSAGLPIR